MNESGGYENDTQPAILVVYTRTPPEATRFDAYRSVHIRTLIIVNFWTTFFCVSDAASQKMISCREEKRRQVTLVTYIGSVC